MSLIVGENIGKFYGDNLIIKEASFRIDERGKIGLIGNNGVGKTTLLKIISGEIEAEEGRIERRKDLKIGYLAQEVNLDSRKVLYEEAKGAFHEILAIEERMHQLARMMSEDKDGLSQILSKYGDLEEKFEKWGGYTYQARLKEVLNGIGFGEADFGKTVEHLSGGEKTRLCYARLLLREPDLLLLDEPTNHLDIEAIEWLESYLANYKGAMVVISHDRYFLDRTVEKIWELERGSLRCYRGNYTCYLEQKREFIARWKKTYELQKEEISRQEEFIRRNIAGQKTKQAKSRRKMLQKMERTERPQREKKIIVEFSPERRGGDEVLRILNLGKSFGEKTLFKNLSFNIQRGERWGMIGPNGTGKTTLLRIIMGEEEPDSGQVKIGKGIKSGYYDQHLAQLNPQNSVLEEVRWADPGLKDEELRSFLGKLLFTREETFSSIEDLSGGEQARVLLAKLILNRVNFLIMDEPTNHLDLNSRKVLEEALLEYDGTILVVSHDRYLLDRIAKVILYFEGSGEIKLYPGNYSYFLERRKEEERPTKKRKLVQGKKSRGKSIKKTHSSDGLEEIEAEIATFERKKEEVMAKLGDERIYSDSRKTSELIEEYQEVSRKLDLLYDEWGRREATL